MTACPDGQTPAILSWLALISSDRGSDRRSGGVVGMLVARSEDGAVVDRGFADSYRSGHTELGSAVWTVARRPSCAGVW